MREKATYLLALLGAFVMIYNPVSYTHLGAQFDKPLKFCGECGKPMGATT